MKILNELRFRMAEKRHLKNELKEDAVSPIHKETILWITIITLGFFYLKSQNFSEKSMIIVVGFIMGNAIIFLIAENIKLKHNMKNHEKSQDVRDTQIVRQIEYKKEQERDLITHIILKNDEGYDIKSWSVGKSNSIIIGKSSRIKVDVDLEGVSNHQLISRNHALLNKTDKGWYLEDLASRNGTGIARMSDNRKIKLEGEPQKVQSGDKIYIGKTELLLK